MGITKSSSQATKFDSEHLFVQRMHLEKKKESADDQASSTLAVLPNDIIIYLCSHFLPTRGILNLEQTAWKYLLLGRKEEIWKAKVSQISGDAIDSKEKENMGSWLELFIEMQRIAKIVRAGSGIEIQQNGFALKKIDINPNPPSSSQQGAYNTGFSDKIGPGWYYFRFKIIEIGYMAFGMALASSIGDDKIWTNTENVFHTTGCFMHYSGVVHPSSVKTAASFSKGQTIEMIFNSYEGKALYFFDGKFSCTLSPKDYTKEMQGPYLLAVVLGPDYSNPRCQQQIEIQRSHRISKEQWKMWLSKI